MPFFNKNLTPPKIFHSMTLVIFVPPQKIKKIQFHSLNHIHCSFSPFQVEKIALIGVNYRKKIWYDRSYTQKITRSNTDHVTCRQGWQPKYPPKKTHPKKTPQKNPPKVSFFVFFLFFFQISKEIVIFYTLYHHFFTK